MGFIIIENGALKVRLDRGAGPHAQQIVVPFHPHQWQLDEAPKMLPMHKAMCCYELDRAYQLSQGKWQVPHWEGVKREADRIAWTEPPRTDDKFRVELWHKVMELLTNR